MTIDRILLWGVTILMWILALGFVLCVVFLSFTFATEFKQWRKGLESAELMIMFAVMLAASLAVGTGFVFIALAIGRNLV